jgi:hypothetical protein
MFVSGGAPTYGRPVPVADYLSEQSVLKHCTVALLNSSRVPAEQAFPGQYDGKTWPTMNISVYDHAGQNLATSRAATARRVLPRSPWTLRITLRGPLLVRPAARL